MIPEIMISFLFLLTVAIIIALTHMIAPDHWIPLVSLASKNKYSNPKKFGIASLIGSGHAAISGLLALLIVIFGMVFLKGYVNDLIDVSIILLIAIGAYFIINGYSESRESNRGIENSIIAVSVFPDLAIIPIIISSSQYPLMDTLIIFLGFLIASVISINIMVFLSSLTIGERFSKMKPEHMDYAIGVLLFMTAIVVILFPSF
ncbi:MAG: hypothetical protein ACYCSG_00575 [Thermoplasmataceae archaeon]